MNIMELFDPAPPGYHSEKEDQNVAKKTDPRGATRLTLAHLHQLRLSHDVKKLEHEQKLEQISTQYTPPAEPGAAMM